MSKKKRKNKSKKYNKNLQLLSYNITEEPVEDKYTKQIPKKIIDQLQNIQEKINLKPKDMIPQLMDYIKKYPNAPLFYNYLSAAYAQAGDIKKCESTILESIKKHPNYLFAKLNYADICLRKGEPEKVPGILNHKLDLKLMYPKRSTFHISEFVGFTSVMCKYYNSVGERETAEILFENLKQIAPKNAATKQIKRVLYPSLIGRIFGRLMGWR
jgi:tetratricopeptide (TPR) repeat protein